MMDVTDSGKAHANILPQLINQRINRPDAQ